MQDFKDENRNWEWKTRGASNGSRQNVIDSFIFYFVDGIESDLRQGTRIKHFGTFCHGPLQDNKLA